MITFKLPCSIVISNASFNSFNVVQITQSSDRVPSVKFLDPGRVQSATHILPGSNIVHSSLLMINKITVQVTFETKKEEPYLNFSPDKS